MCVYRDIFVCTHTHKCTKKVNNVYPTVSVLGQGKRDRNHPPLQEFLANFMSEEKGSESCLRTGRLQPSSSR